MYIWDLGEEAEAGGVGVGGEVAGFFGGAAEAEVEVPEPQYL